MRTQHLDAATGTIIVSADRAAAIAQVAAHYDGLFGDDPALRELREAYAMRDGTVPDRRAPPRAHRVLLLDRRGRRSTKRPGSTMTYTNNWPHEPLVGNAPTASTFLWTVFSVLFLIAGIGAARLAPRAPGTTRNRRWRRPRPIRCAGSR